MNPLRNRGVANIWLQNSSDLTEALSVTKANKYAITVMPPAFQIGILADVIFILGELVDHTDGLVNSCRASLGATEMSPGTQGGRD